LFQEREFSDIFFDRSIVLVTLCSSKKLMQDETVDELIEELRSLRIQQATLIDRIENAIRIESEQNERNEREQNDDDAGARAVFVFGFRKGDRVRIKNKVKKPAAAGPTWSESRERLATVTRIRADQIHIRTDNGTATWRAPNNLEIITDR
jgi:hypothetical protein